MAGGVFLGRPNDEALTRSVYGEWAAGPDPDAGLFSGAFTAPFIGMKHGLDVAAAVTSDYLTEPLKEITPDFMDDWLDGQRREAHRNMVESRSDPKSMGAIGQALHAIGSVGVEGALGAVPGAFVGVATAGPAGAAVGAKTGAVTSIGALSAYDKYEELRLQGVDDSTAAKVAGITGSVMGVGAMLPAFMGQTLTKQIASGVGINVGLGFVERGGSAEVLKGAGYTEMAEHYQMLDGTAVLIDAALGAFFPLGGRVISRMSSRGVDVAMDANRTVNDQLRDPGLQTTPEGIDAKAAADAEVSRQIMEEGRTPDAIEVPPGVMDDTVPSPAIGELTARAARVMDELTVSEGGAPMAITESIFHTIKEAHRHTDDAVRKHEPQAKRVPDEQRVPPEKMDDQAIIDESMEQSVNKIVEEDPLRTVIDDEGRERAAGEFVAEAKKVLEDQHKEAALYKVAISCAIGVGL
jgi:hypothetical protein